MKIHRRVEVFARLLYMSICKRVYYYAASVVAADLAKRVERLKSGSEPIPWSTIRAEALAEIDGRL